VIESPANPYCFSVAGRHLSDTITYEQPLNERIRILLRLESLFKNIQDTLYEPTPASSHATLERLQEILTLTDRSELKKDLMKELDRNHLTLSALREHPGVNPAQLDQFLDKIQQLNGVLDTERGKPGQKLRNSEFLKSFRQRSGVPGGLSDIDFPHYHFWLNLPAEERITSLADWVGSFDTIREAVSLVLDMIRRSATPTTVLAHKGFYQHSLDKDTPYQLIRVSLPSDAPYYVEISGGRHRFSARFMFPSLEERPVQAMEDISFQLTTCIL
jgi:cell division protein ZapD